MVTCNQSGNIETSMDVSGEISIGLSPSPIDELSFMVMWLAPSAVAISGVLLELGTSSESLEWFVFTSLVNFSSLNILSSLDISPPIVFSSRVVSSSESLDWFVFTSPVNFSSLDILSSLDISPPIVFSSRVVSFNKSECGEIIDALPVMTD